MSNSQIDRDFYSSLVIEHIVPNGQDYAFKRWHSDFMNGAKLQTGFLRCDRCPPLDCKDGVVKWYSIIHFDSPNNLKAWVESDDRKSLLESGQHIFRAYRFKSFTTGLEGWFSQSISGSEQTSLGAPAWKQIVLVVSGLYPIVVVQSKLFTAFGLTKSWSPAISMLMNIVITSSLLALVIMPITVRLMSFWLKPAYRKSSLRSDVLGLTMIMTALGFMVFIFSQF